MRELTLTETSAVNGAGLFGVSDTLAVWAHDTLVSAGYSIGCTIGNMLGGWLPVVGGLINGFAGAVGEGLGAFAGRAAHDVIKTLFPL